MKCPKCNSDVANFTEWSAGKCFKTKCSSCSATLEANNKTLFSLVILLFIFLGGAVAIMIKFEHLGVGRGAPGALITVFFTLIIIYPLWFFIYKFIGGYWVSKDR